jgi:hypothetical protein
MARATNYNGQLQPINCTVTINGTTMKPRILPDITDSKSASYNDESVIGRSFPIKTFSHGDNRSISMKWHILIVDTDTLFEAVQQLKAFTSLVYPQAGAGNTPYQPPTIATIDCGQILSAGSGVNFGPLCVVLKSYNITYPTDVAWNEDFMIPYKFDIDLSWDVVYATSELPNSDMIIGF